MFDIYFYLFILRIVTSDGQISLPSSPAIGLLPNHIFETSWEMRQGTFVLTIESPNNRIVKTSEVQEDCVCVFSRLVSMAMIRGVHWLLSLDSY